MKKNQIDFFENYKGAFDNFREELKAEHFGKALKARLMGEELPSMGNSDFPAWTAHQQKLIEIFKIFSSLFDSLESMKMSAYFLKNHSLTQLDKNEGITEAKFLTYHYEKYLHESVVFRNSLFRLIKTVERQSGKKFALLKRIAQKIESEARNLIVHEAERYDDTVISQLNLLALFQQKEKGSEEFRMLLALTGYAFKKKRDELSKIILDNTEKFDEAFDQIIKKLNPAIFSG